MVYTAIIMACHVVITGQCHSFIDNRGPYATREECVVRIQEMTNDIVMMNYRPIIFQCTANEGELT